MVLQKHKELVTLLLERGARMDIRTVDGFTVMMNAAANKQVVGFLLLNHEQWVVRHISSSSRLTNPASVYCCRVLMTDRNARAPPGARRWTASAYRPDGQRGLHGSVVGGALWSGQGHQGTDTHRMRLEHSPMIDVPADARVCR